MPTRRVLQLFGIAAICGLALTGCAAGPVALAPTAIQAAKAQTLKVQHELVAGIPAKDVTDVYQPTKAALLSCSTGYQWPGIARLTLSGSLNEVSIVKKLKKQFSTKVGWTVGPAATANTTGFQLHQKDGRSFYVDFSDDGKLFEVTSLSACIPFKPKAGAEY